MKKVIIVFLAFLLLGAGVLISCKKNNQDAITSSSKSSVASTAALNTSAQRQQAGEITVVHHGVSFTYPANLSMAMNGGYILQLQPMGENHYMVVNATRTNDHIGTTGDPIIGGTGGGGGYDPCIDAFYDFYNFMQQYGPDYQDYANTHCVAFAIMYSHGNCYFEQDIIPANHCDQIYWDIIHLY
jgi:hypothetical protein